MARRTLPTQARLKELFDYEPETGKLIAKTAKDTRRGAYEAGDVVGHRTKFGYVVVTVDGHPYGVHRIAHKWMTGEEPPTHMDHINRVRDDNRWSNLRPADKYLNAANVGRSRLNLSGAKGVSRLTGGKWHATIKVRGETRNLGLFDDWQKAVDAYDAAAKEAWGEFACTDASQSDCRVFVDVVTLVDEQLLFAMARAAGRLFSFCLDPAVPPHVQTTLDDIGLDLSTELARIDPKTYGQWRKRA